MTSGRSRVKRDFSFLRMKRSKLRPILPKPLGPHKGKQREYDKSQLIVVKGLCEIQMDQVHGGARHPASIAFQVKQHLRQANGLTFIEIRGRQNQQYHRH